MPLNPPQLTVTAVWMAGSMVGRALGVALLASADITGIFQNIIRIIFGLASSPPLFNFIDIFWLLAFLYRHLIGILLVCGEAFFDRPIKASEMQADSLSLAIRHHSCRWIKARYHYALKRRKTPFSISSPLRDVSLMVEFYVMTLKPTHVSAVTHQERLFCDWCK
jgi:hypothetical protein